MLPGFLKLTLVFTGAHIALSLIFFGLIFALQIVFGLPEYSGHPVEKFVRFVLNVMVQPGEFLTGKIRFFMQSTLLDFFLMALNSFLWGSVISLTIVGLTLRSTRTLPLRGNVLDHHSDSSSSMQGAVSTAPVSTHR